jgi:hypothetical protein
MEENSNAATSMSVKGFIVQVPGLHLPKMVMAVIDKHTSLHCSSIYHYSKTCYAKGLCDHIHGPSVSA